jgi:signal transduction histidine kinase
LPVSDPVGTLLAGDPYALTHRPCPENAIVTGPTEGSTQRIEVLLVEDSAGDARLVRQMLAEAHSPVFEVTHVQRLAEALLLLRDGRFDLVLLDLTLPDSRGLETLSRIRDHDSQVPIVILSGHEDEALAVEAVQKGAQDYLFKNDIDHSMVRSIRYALERKRIEEALRESNRQLELALEELQKTQQQSIRQERLRALGEMAGGVAHSFNNSLTPILGFSDLLLDRPENLENRGMVRLRLEMIRAAAQDAATMVRRLREFYRNRQAGELLVPANLNQVIGQAISLTQPRWKDQALAAGVDIRVVTELQDLPPFVCNEADARECLINLIFNSVDAMPDGGTIQVRTSTEDDHIIVRVSDTGAGMTEEVRLRCLEPFFSTKGKRGSGLGLATVYGFVQRHRGTIDVESESGKGTTFILRLPVQNGPKPGDKKPETAPKAAATPGRGGEHDQQAAGGPRPKRVLVVDDEPLVRGVITAYLTCDGHVVEAAVDGRDGLERFRAGKFDLVLTDKAMPEMNGERLSMLIKELAPDMPIILLTGFEDFVNANGEQPKSVDLVLAKPLTLDDLRAAIVKVTAPR